jgi:hypothetical protein
MGEIGPPVDYQTVTIVPLEAGVTAGCSARAWADLARLGGYLRVRRTVTAFVICILLPPGYAGVQICSEPAALGETVDS